MNRSVSHDYKKEIKRAFSPSSETPSFDNLLSRARNGDSETQFVVGVLYYMGRGVSQNPAEAAMWFRKAAEQGCLEAQSLLEEMYFQRLMAVEDYSEAIEWLHKASQQNLAQAHYAMGLIFGMGLDVPRYYIEACKFFELSAAKGNHKASEILESVEQKMSEEEIAEARRRAAAFAQFIEAAIRKE